MARTLETKSFFDIGTPLDPKNEPLPQEPQTH